MTKEYSVHTWMRSRVRIQSKWSFTGLPFSLHELSCRWHGCYETERTPDDTIAWKDLQKGIGERHLNKPATSWPRYDREPKREEARGSKKKRQRHVIIRGLQESQIAWITWWLNCANESYNINASRNPNEKKKRGRGPSRNHP